MDRGTRELALRWGSKDLPFSLPPRVQIEEATPAIGGSIEGKNAEKEKQFVDARVSKELAMLGRKLGQARRVLVVSDDHTRVTPVDVLLPPIIAAAKLAKKPVSIMIAGGSHRHMTRDEKRIKFGAAIVDEIPIIDHEWSDESTMVNFGNARGGYDIKLARIACDAGTFIVGLGNIVPHRVCGFSGGYKILMPGLTCQATMNRIHYASAGFSSEQILGVARNPVRDAINEIGKHRPIDFLINTVLDGASRIVSLCLGNPVESQYEGAGVAKEIYGVKVGTPADLVIADAAPEHVDWWLCAKAACNCKSFVKPGGHLVLLTPCTEGWSPAHEGILLKYGYHPPAEIDALVSNGSISPDHLLEASHLAHVGEVLAHCNVHLVSDTLDKKIIGKQGFDVIRALDFPAFVHDLATDLRDAARGGIARVKVVRRGAEILPLP